MIATSGGFSACWPLAANFGAAPMSAGAEEVLKTYTIPADFFNVNGKRLRATFWGNFAANANAKTVRLRLGGLAGTVIFTKAAAFNNTAFRIVCDIQRRGSDTQEAISGWLESGTIAANLADAEMGSTALDDGATIALVLTGQGTAAGDVNAMGYLVEAFAPPPA